MSWYTDIKAWIANNIRTNHHREITGAKMNTVLNDIVDEVENKVDKVSGKGLSTNDYNNTEKAKVANSYSKPSGGIPKSDLSSAVQTSLGKADTAVQTETDPTVPSWAKSQTKPTYTASEVGAIPATDKGANGGVATLDNAGKVPQSQLPSYVDDVLEYANLASFPATGESGKIYVALDTNKTYRWSGSAYVEISQSLALGETSSTAFPGDRGKAIEDKIPSNASSSNKLATKAEMVPAGGTTGQVLAKKSNTDNDLEWVNQSGGGGTVDPYPTEDSTNPVQSGGVYEELRDKQDIIPDLTDIRSGAAAGATAYQKPSTGIPKTDLANDVQTSIGKADTAFQKPSDGIPASDLASGVQTSLGKADTAVQQVTVGATTTGAAGTNASVNNSGTATAPVLDFTIPRGADGADGQDGADAVNPFKGWYDNSSNLPANPVVGDYAYVKGATISDPVAIYECTTAGTWSDSGMKADTSNVQTFASGEEVNEVHIVDDLTTGGSNDVLSAEAGNDILGRLGGKLDKTIYEEEYHEVEGTTETKKYISKTNGSVESTTAATIVCAEYAVTAGGTYYVTSGHTGSAASYCQYDSNDDPILTTLVTHTDGEGSYNIKTRVEIVAHADAVKIRVDGVNVDGGIIPKLETKNVNEYDAEKAIKVVGDTSQFNYNTISQQLAKTYGEFEPLTFLSGKFYNKTGRILSVGTNKAVPFVRVGVGDVLEIKNATNSEYVLLGVKANKPDGYVELISGGTFNGYYVITDPDISWVIIQSSGNPSAAILRRSKHFKSFIKKVDANNIIVVFSSGLVYNFTKYYHVANDIVCSDTWDCNLMYNIYGSNANTLEMGGYMAQGNSNFILQAITDSGTQNHTGDGHGLEVSVENKFLIDGAEYVLDEIGVGSVVEFNTIAYINRSIYYEPNNGGTGSYTTNTPKIVDEEPVKQFLRYIRQDYKDDGSYEQVNRLTCLQDNTRFSQIFGAMLECYYIHFDEVIVEDEGNAAAIQENGIFTPINCDITITQGSYTKVFGNAITYIGKNFIIRQSMDSEIVRYKYDEGNKVFDGTCVGSTNLLIYPYGDRLKTYIMPVICNEHPEYAVMDVFNSGDVIIAKSVRDVNFAPYFVKAVLTGCTLSNKITAIQENADYETFIVPDDGKTLNSVVVEIGHSGEFADYTSTFYDETTHKVSIKGVNDYVRITATAV